MTKKQKILFIIMWIAAIAAFLFFSGGENELNLSIRFLWSVI